MSRQRWASPVSSLASTPAPAVRAAWYARVAAGPDAMSVPGTSSKDRSHS